MCECGQETMSGREAAAYLHVDPRTLARWRDEGKIAYSQPSLRVYIYRRADLDEYLAITRTEATWGRNNGRARRRAA